MRHCPLWGEFPAQRASNAEDVSYDVIMTAVGVCKLSCNISLHRNSNWRKLLTFTLHLKYHEMSRKLVGHVELYRLVTNMHLGIITALETRTKIYLNSKSKLYRLWHGRVTYFGSFMYVGPVLLYMHCYLQTLLFITLHLTAWSLFHYIYISSGIQNYEILVYPLVTNEQNNDTKQGYMHLWKTNEVIDIGIVISLFVYNLKNAQFQYSRAIRLPLIYT